jgi:hypothetical protein
MKQTKEYKEFFIDKNSNTYAETLETYGLAHLVDEILTRANTPNRKVEITDMGVYYYIKPSQAITEEMLSKIGYFQVIKFLKKQSDTEVPADIGNNFYDYPNQKKEFDAIKEARNKISTDKKMKPEEKKEKLLALNNLFESEFGKKLDEAFDVYKNIVDNHYEGCIKAHSILHNNQRHFDSLLKEILDFYSITPNVLQKVNFIHLIKEKD